MSEGWRVPTGEAARYRADGSWLPGVKEVLARTAGCSGEGIRLDNSYKSFQGGLELFALAAMKGSLCRLDSQQALLRGT
jgi:hypothetical protein